MIFRGQTCKVFNVFQIQIDRRACIIWRLPMHQSVLCGVEILQIYKCDSAVHSSTLGCGQSSLSLAAETGIRYKSTDPFFKQMKKIDSIRKYHSQRKSSQQYTLSRHLERKKKCIQKMKDNSLYTTATASVSNEHAHGINMNN